MPKDVKRIVDAIRSAAAQARGLLVPVSGGSDSALCFWLCARAFPEKTFAVHAGTALRSAAWFASVGPVEYVDVPGRHEEREEMRWARFLAMSLERRAWLVGSRNRTEDELGTYSLASRVATFLPITGIWKSDVQRLCEVVGVPADIIASSRRADPDCGRPAELAELPFDAIDAFLRVRTGEASDDAVPLAPPERAYLEGVFARNAFKRTLPVRGGIST